MSVVDVIGTEETRLARRRELPRPVASAYMQRKRWLDATLAAVLLVPALPVMALLIVLIRLTSRGPAIYPQERLGLNGRRFVMLKLRSMRIDAESKTGPVWAIEDDPRVTFVGRFMRKLHLDELPQLFNVLRGEMSLVGPRPERPEIAVLLVEDIANFKDRLLVLPGVTGLAQINLPPDTTVDDARRKLVLDIEYIVHGNLLLDVRILSCTLLRIMGLSGYRAMRLMGLQRDVRISEPVRTELPRVANPR